MKTKGYVIFNRRTGAQVGGVIKDVRRARNRRDRLDNIYGAYVHTVINADKRAVL